MSRQAKDGMNVSSWRLFDDDIEKFKHEVELYKKMGEEIEVSYTDEIILPQDSEINSGRHEVLALVISTTETFRRLSYILNV